jgi:hypothetical protein
MQLLCVQCRAWMLASLLLLVCPGLLVVSSVGESILLLLAWFGFNDGGQTG